mgnify:CR=1 FL=1
MHGPSSSSAPHPSLQAANPELYFVEVTKRCETEKLWRPLGTDKCSESTYCIDIENGTNWEVNGPPHSLAGSTPPPSLCK